MQNTEDIETEKLKEAVIQGILKKKGKEIVILDLLKINNAVCRYFILCHGDSNIQVGAITESVEKVVREKTHEKVWHREGLQLAQWVLLDYGDIVVHVFQKPFREFYNLEELWADAAREEIGEALNINERI
ncbi:MAG: ribosome silencing factor [Chlorobi bacterium]|nr:ribosome silencing factor [Chlorobiota bacterium]